MNRRQFLTAAGAGTAALLAAKAERVLGAPAEQPTPRKRALMKVGCQRWGSSQEKMPFLVRHGVQMICASPARTQPDGGWLVEDLVKIRQSVEAQGLQLGSMYWGVPITVLQPTPARDRAIDGLCKMIRAAGQAGVPSLQYNLHIRTWKARTGSTPGRGGVTYSTWDLAKGPERDKSKPDLGPITPEEMWGRITYFLERVVPVATEARVKLACHPPDPPVPAGFWGLAQVLDTVEGLQKFVSIMDSDYHCLTFCQGTVCEMLQNPGEEIYEVIRWFGERKKIAGVHFRNIRGKRDNFTEVYPDEGDVDMLKAMKVYRDVGYEGMMMPDHVPGDPGDPEGMQGFAYGYAYTKALIQAADTTD